VSADNYIAIQQIGPEWKVWMAFDSDDETRAPRDAASWPTKELATAYAAGWLRGEMIVEYGIRYLQPIDPPRCPNCHQEMPAGKEAW